MNIKNRLIAFLLILATCLSTALMLHYHSTQLITHAKKHTNDPNLIVVNTSFSSFNKTGLLHFYLTSPKVIHYPEKSTVVITKPNLIVFSNKRNKWKITADNGLARNNNKEVILWGHVKISQPKTLTSPATDITTSKILFYPQRAYAETDEEVTIKRPEVTLSAKGATVDFNKGILKTKSQTRGVYTQPEINSK